MNLTSSTKTINTLTTLGNHCSFGNDSNKREQKTSGVRYTLIAHGNHRNCGNHSNESNPQLSAAKVVRGNHRNYSNHGNEQGHITLTVSSLFAVPNHRNYGNHGNAKVDESLQVFLLLHRRCIVYGRGIPLAGALVPKKRAF